MKWYIISILVIVQAIHWPSTEAVNVPAPPPVKAFIKFFSQAVQSSKTLQNLFNLGTQVPSEEFATGIFYQATMAGYISGDSDATRNGDAATQYIADAFDQITFPVLTRVYSGSLGRFLNDVGKLSEDNAAEMAENLAQATEYIYTKAVDDKIPRSKVTAVNMGFETFLLHLGLYTAKNDAAFKKAYGDEWIYVSSNLTDAPPHKNSHCTTEQTLQQDTSSSSVSTDSAYCYKTSSTVASFRNELFKSVLANRFAKNLLDFKTISTKEASRALFYVAHYLFTLIAENNEASDVQFLSNFVSELDSLKLPLILRAVSNVVGKLLEHKGILKDSNAADMAHDFAKIMEKWGRKVPSNPKDERSKMVLFALSFAHFPLQMGGWGPDDTKDFIHFFANEVNCEVLRQKQECNI